MKFVIAIGGNAVNRPGEKPTAENMMKNLKKSMEYLIDIIRDHSVVITHGNGPQVGNLLLQQEAAKDIIPPFPLDVNDAQTQGSLGYMICQTLRNTIVENNLKKEVVAVVTQIVVDPEDPAFQNPTKPVGPFYEEEEAKKIMKDKKWIMVEDAGRGWRRVVPSPIPIDIIEKDAIKFLVDNGFIVIAAGGGGIPVIKLEDGTLKGVEAVIDKDRASSLLARELNTDMFIILTGVEKVYLNFNSSNKIPLDKLTVEEAEKYLKEGHFPPGSMGPKIESAIDFVRKTGKECLITDMAKLKQALEGKTGTRIVPGV